MPGKSANLENALLALIFNGTTVANIANNASTSPLTNLFVALHFADPGDTGNQTTSEVGYTGYGRVSVARSGAGWTVSANSVSPAANISFPACTGGSNTATHFSVGYASTGSNTIIYSGTITPSISISNGVTPVLTTSSTITEG